ncbi:polysaccharide deacetylase family protein [Halalkalibacter alkalisediminis]|uniref:Polysaccharide deacetylase family protein n=1 Tax=Halalkalibacter alkalisediminis TaxID=935616 RepID=A0ABV6NAF3_9BACI|nr:polysaccharide deacetylase family protein [Halalkalibacter alkalisediminis]
MKKISIVIVFLVWIITACQTMIEPERDEVDLDSKEKGEETSDKIEDPVTEDEDDQVEMDLATYENRQPLQWGESVEGVKTRINTDEKVIALTFDACGGPFGNGYDEELMNFLKEEQVPATLFFNERWIKEHEQAFLDLANNPLFQIENHGTDHVPLSVNGQSAWGIKGTDSPVSIQHEVMGNQETIKALTGRAPTLFRSGTAYYDEVAVEIVNELGMEIVNFDVLGDAGATYSAEQVHQAILGATNGSIVLLHMNQPDSGTAMGVKKAVQDLRDKGFTFVLLEGMDLK